MSIKTIVLGLAAVLLLVAAGMVLAGADGIANASHSSTSTSTAHAGGASPSTATLAGRGEVPNDDAYLSLEPSLTDFGCTTPATCSNPPNGGIVTTGQR